MNHTSGSLNQMAVNATLHCLLGCSIGEIIGMVISTAYNFSNVASVVLSIVLAFAFGYGLSLSSVVRSGVALRKAMKVVLAADTVSIASMEITDNAVVIFIPGALDAHLTDVLFWVSLAISLVVAFVVTVPVNRGLLARGKGHALMHHHHNA